jgi:hypothetical protein
MSILGSFDALHSLQLRKGGAHVVDPVLEPCRLAGGEAINYPRQRRAVWHEDPGGSRRAWLTHSLTVQRKPIYPDHQELFEPGRNRELRFVLRQVGES